MTNKVTTWADERDAIIDMVREGKTKQEIAEHYGVTFKAIDSAFYRLDISVRHLRGDKPYRAYVPEIKALAEKQYTQKQIAAHLSIPYQRVKDILHMHGISLRAYRQPHY